MSALVGYASSDDEDDIQPERPAKVAKIEPTTSTRTPQQEQYEQAAPPVPTNDTQPDPHPPPTTEPNAPPPGPSAQPPSDPTPTHTPSSPPPSPYTTERQRLRDLTMPTTPNFNIPNSPSSPPQNSEEAATLAATTKKFERFLELKKQGVHFNERLQNSASLRNPSLLPKLMEFAGMSREESYASTLPEEVAVPVAWQEQCYVENLVKENERLEKKRVKEREKVEFVSASAGDRSGASSKAGTPKDGGGGGGGQRKSRFDKR